MQTVLITGGTGLVGKALTQLLTDKGYAVIILSREPDKQKAAAAVNYAQWDVKKQQLDIAALQKADYIIHLAGAGVMDKKWTEDYKKEIVSSRTESARLIVNSLQQKPHKVKAVISASAIGYYGEDSMPPKAFTELDAPDNNFLGETCKLWEASIEPVTELNIRLVKYRIGIVLSAKGGALKEFMNPLKFGIATILGNGKQMISWIHIDDLCRLFLYAIENENIQGAYNAVAPAPVDNKNLTLTLAKKMKGKFYIPMYVPQLILKIMLGQRSIEILKSATVSDKKITGTGFNFQFKTIETALKDIVKN